MQYETEPTFAALDKQWYFERNGSQIGPLSENEIIALIRSNDINHNTLVWKQGYTNWFPIADTTLSTYLLQQPPPITTTGVNRSVTNYGYSNTKSKDDLVWILAFAPLIGGIIDMLLGIWITTLIINIVLSYLDEKRLKEQGVDTSTFGASWLIPVYLYKRYKYFNSSPAYFVIWITTFIFSFFLV